MPLSEYDDDGHDSGVDEDAELELSCALHDLAERVKTFEENMKTRLHIKGITGSDDASDDEEIGEDIPEVDDDDRTTTGATTSLYGYASPKRKKMTKKSTTSSSSSSKAHCRRPPRYAAKQSSKQQNSDDDEDDDEDDDDCCYEEEEEEEEDAKRSSIARKGWDEQNERDELCEMKNNISLLLQGMKEQAKALEAADCETNQ